MSIVRWAKLATTTPLTAVVAKLNELLGGKGAAAAFSGGAKADDALDGDGTLTTGVAGTATIAGKSAGGVAASWSVALMETFDVEPDWTVLSGVKAQSLVNTGQTGGKALRQAGPVVQAFPYDSLAFDASKLYRLRARVKRVSGSGTFSYGVQAIDAAGAVLGTYAVCASLATPGFSYTEYTGWLKGFGSPIQPASDPLNPAGLPSGTVSVRPYYALNGSAPGGVMDLDLVDFDRQDEEAHARTYDTLLPSTDADRLATGAGLKADTVNSASIQTNVVITGAVVSQDDPAIFLDLRTGLGPTDPVFQHPALVLYFGGDAVFGGTVVAGRFQNAANTYYLDLTSTNPSVVLPGFTSSAGVTTFSGIVSADTFTASLAIFSGGVEAAGYNTAAGGPYQVQGNGFSGAAYALRIEYVGFGVNEFRSGPGHRMEFYGTGFLFSTTVTVSGGVTASGTGQFGSLIVSGTSSYTTLNVSGTATVGTLSHAGSAAGFFGTAPVSRPTLTYSRTGEPASVAQIRAALASLGLVFDSTTP